jgi:hypothetical protein
MRKKLSRKLISYMLYFFLLSNAMCMFNINSIWKQLHNIHDLFRSNKTKDSKQVNFIEKKLNDNYNYYTKGMELYNYLLNTFITPNKDNFSKKAFTKHSRKENSLFHRIILSDFMVFYALGEVIISLVFAFLFIPLVLLIRRWIKSVRKVKMKETYASKDSLSLCEKGELCSICLSEIVDYSESLLISKLECEHFFHCKCIKEWMKLAGTCPVCRKKVDSIVYIELINIKNA